MNLAAHCWQSRKTFFKAETPMLRQADAGRMRWTALVAPKSDEGGNHPKNECTDFVCNDSASLSHIHQHSGPCNSLNQSHRWHATILPFDASVIVSSRFIPQLKQQEFFVRRLNRLTFRLQSPLALMPSHQR
jgi:hypothetical protein